MAQIKQPAIDVKVHRRVLSFLNAARRPEDLMVAPQKGNSRFLPLSGRWLPHESGAIE